MKKLTSVLSAVLVVVALTLQVFAVPQADPAEKFYDYAHLISTNDELRLREELQQLSASSGFDVAAVIMDDNEGYSSADYANDFYDYNGFSEDGLILLINLDDREVYISTCGEAMSYFTDGIIDDMTYELVEPLADGDYGGAVSLFVQQCTAILQAPPKGESSSVSTQKPPIYEAPQEAQRTDWAALIGTAAVGSAVFGGIVVAIMAALHNRLPNKTQATFHYVVGGQVRLTKNLDLFINSTLRKTRIQQDTGTRSGGGGRSHSHTSMHRSSSGRMHGGGGRKF